MKKRLIVILSVLAAALLFFGMPAMSKAAGPVNVSGGVTMKALNDAGVLLLTGRTVVNPAGYLETDFASTGFKANITANSDTTIELTVSSNITLNYTVLLDGKATHFTGRNGNNVKLSLPVTRGTHVIEAYRADNITSGNTDYVRMNSLKFDGTVDSAVAEKSIYLEIIGDSMAVGSHSTATYVPGTGGQPKDHLFTNGWAWFACELLDADLSLVAQGGIGLDGSDKQESDAGQTNMQSLYDYTSYRTMRENIPYDFANSRTPDAVIVGLGENDGYDNSPEPLSAAWTEKAVQFILQIKDRHGDVPVVWHISGPRRKGYYYRGLYDAIHTDARLTVYDNIYVFYNWFDRNGGAALLTQVQGHPNTTGYYDGGVRLAEYLATSGILRDKLTPATAVSQIEYYISASGNDQNDGMSDLTPLLTVGEILNRLPNESALSTDAELVIKVAGSMTAAVSGNVLFGQSSPVRRSDGTLLPIRIESAGEERASLNLTLSSDSQAIASVQPLTLKNLKLTADKETALYADLSRIVLDDVHYEGAGTLGVYANAIGSAAFSAASSGATSEIILKNGSYTAENGFGLIAPYGPELGTFSDKTYTASVTIAEYAVVNNVRLVADTITKSVKEVVLEVAPDGVIRTGSAFVGTPSGTFNTDLTVNITGGSVYGGFTMLGDQTTVNGTVTFTMTGGGIYVDRETNARNASIILGGSYDTATVANIENRITGGALYIAAAADVPSTMYFAGRDHQTVTGTVHNYTKHAVFLLMNASGVSTSAMHAENDIVFGMRSGTIQGELVNDMISGFFDTRDISRSVYFGARTSDAAIRKLTNTVGFDIPNELNGGPLCWTNALYLGSVSGEIGVTAHRTVDLSQAAVSETVLSNTIYGGQFYSGIYTSPLESASSGTAVFGGIENTIEGGAFRNYTYSRFAFNFGANNTTVFGHVKTVINDGFFMDLSITDAGNGEIRDGVEAIFNGGLDYTRATGVIYNVYALNGNNLKAETPGTPAYALTVNGGTYHGDFFLDTGAATITGSTVIDVKGGYFNNLQAAAQTGFITGGYFQNAPEEALFAEGMAALIGAFSNTDARDIAGYEFCAGPISTALRVTTVASFDGGSPGDYELGGAGYYQPGGTGLLSAPSIKTFEFVGWYKGDTLVSTTASYLVTITESADYTAKYHWDGIVNLEIYGSNFNYSIGSVSGTAVDYYTRNIPVGTAVTLTFNGSNFSAWTDRNGTTLSMSKTYSFTMNGETSISAKVGSTITHTHTHCICGMDHETIGDHADQENNTWLPISSYKELLAYRNSGESTFYLYLTDDIAIDWFSGDAEARAADSNYGPRFLPKDNQTYAICLNGHKITGGAMRIFALGATQNVTITLTDCKRTGEVRASTYGSKNPDKIQGAKIFQGSKTSTLNLYGGVTISGAYTRHGGAGSAFQITGTCNIYDAYIENNINASQRAGAFYVTSAGAVLNMYGGALQHNETVVPRLGEGPALYLSDGAQFNLYGGTISDNHASAGDGGAIAISGKNSVFNMSGGTIENNYTEGTADSRGGQVAIIASVFNMSGGTIRDGRTNHYGGNLALLDAAKMYMTGGLISGGTSSMVGSIGIVGGSKLYMSGGIIEGGTAKTSMAGNIYLNDNGSAIYMSGGEIRNGRAEANGGGNIMVNGSGGVIVELSGDAKVTGGKAVFGGNILIRNNSSLILKDQAEVSGGTVSANSGNVCLANSGANLEMYGDSAIKNGNATGFGGNVGMNASGTSITMNDRASINGGTAGTSAGGINMMSGATLTMNGGTFSGNTAQSTGGALNMSSGTTFIMNGGTIENNHSQRGAGVYCSGTFTMNGGTITSCTTLKPAEQDGGGIAMMSGSTFTMKNGSITKCVGKRGGAIYANNATIKLLGGTIGGSLENANESKSQGGGVLLENSSANLEIDGTALTYNKGAFCGNLCLQEGATGVMKSGMITNGTASTYYGGNVGLFQAARLTVSGGTISDGTAKSYGGNVAVRDAAGAFILTGGTVANGSAETYGGNIYCYGTLTIGGDGIVKDGIAGSAGDNTNAYGGNIVVAGDKVSTISGNALILGGTAPRYGGSIAFVGSNSLKIYGNALIIGGKATGVLAGGNICTTSYNTLEVYENAVVLGGSAAEGGNIAVNDTTSSGSGKKATLKIYGNAIVTGGKATDYGDNIRLLEQGNQAALSISGNASVGGTYTLNDARCGSYNGTYSGGNIFVYKGTDLQITGGSIAKLELHQDLTNEGFITAGYFMEAPEEGWLAAGKAVLIGAFHSANTADTAEYGFTVDDRSNGALIDVNAEAGDGSTMILTTGSGLYKKGETFTVTAAVPEGFRFVGWYENETLKSTDPTYIGVAENDTVLTAVLMLGGDRITVTILSEGAFVVTIGDDTIPATDTYTASIERGTSIRVSYEGEAPFVAWTNASNRILTRARQYDLTAYTDMKLLSSVEDTPVEQTAVVFLTEFNQIYRVLYTAKDASSFTLPETPYRLGRTVTWDKDAAAILAEAASANEVFVCAAVSEASSVYTITVKSGDETIFTKSVPLGDQARIELPEESFAYVKASDNSVISYLPTFYLKADHDVTLTAVYDTAPSTPANVVVITVAKREDKNVTFTATRSILEDAFVAEQGILFTASELTDETFVKGADNVRATIGVETGRIGTMTLNITNVPVKTSVYARAYVILRDGTTIYSDIVKLSGEDDGTIHLPEIPF